MARLLLVEDDENLGFMLKDNLESIGHQVSWMRNGERGLELFRSQKPELCIIDVMMPKMDGFELTENIRNMDEFIPIIFLTAKSLEEDRLKGFEIGGDDYLTKPFSIKELSYRVEVFLRRSIGPTPSTDGIIYFGHSSFDPENLIYSFKEKTFSFTQMEGQLLKLLLNKQNKLVRRDFLLEEIWGENDYFKGRSLDVFITRLRKYLRNDASLEIKNHHSVGYCLMTNKKPG
ncbi:MAG: response regulator transcription factor [Bacteroidota bacterium]